MELTEEQAARAMGCPVCGGELRATSKPWRFRCVPCRIVLRFEDIGTIEAAILAQIDARTAQAVGG